jgi:hypothetical protein
MDNVQKHNICKNALLLDDRGVGVQIQVGSRISCSPRRPDWLYGLWPTLVGAGGSFFVDKATGT